jgi:hypothetical protein
MMFVNSKHELVNGKRMSERLLFNQFFSVHQFTINHK